MTAKRILVIDDEPSVVRLCQQVLEEEGFEVKGALSGEEGLRLLKGRSFALTLLDKRDWVGAGAGQDPGGGAWRHHQGTK